MARRWRALGGAGLCGALLAGACSGGQSGGEVTTNEPDPPDQGAGGGSIQCRVAEDCREEAERVLDLVATPYEADVRLSATACTLNGVIESGASITGPSCECQGSNRSYRLGPLGLGCHVLGRAGNCLFDDTDFTSCDIGDDSSCDAPCAEIEQRLNADAARVVQAELLDLACVDYTCRSVVSLDGRCYVDDDYRYLATGAYDCALGVEAILEQHVIDSAPPPEPERVPVEIISPYAEGSSAFVHLIVGSEHWGSGKTASYFGVDAQFYDAIPPLSPDMAEVIDPLEGIDDCGVSNVFGGGAVPEFRSIESALLRDGDQDYALEEFSSGDRFFAYGVDLAGAGIEPRHQGSYAFTAQGGTFGASIEVSVLVLPEALSVSTLETTSRFDKGPLTMTWTGRGEAPLSLRLWIAPTLSDFSNPYGIECRMVDDGSFTIPESVLAAAPDGFVTAEFQRDNAALVQSNGRLVSSVARALAQHHFALGPACDRQDVMQACLESAERVIATYGECDVEPPPLASLCPSYLSESCLGCPEYFDCVARATTCDARTGMLTRDSRCTCP